MTEIEPFDFCILEGICGYVSDGTAPNGRVIDQVEVVESVLVELLEHVVAQKESVDFDSARGVMRVL